MKSRGEPHRQTNYGDRVYIGDGSQSVAIGNVYPYDQAIRLIDVRTEELGSWVVDLDSRIVVPPVEAESEAKANRVTARISMGTGGLSSVFDVDVYGCARLSLPCEALTVDVTAHDADLLGSATDSPVAVLQTVEATCQRTWANTIARLSIQMRAFAAPDFMSGTVRVPKYACQVQVSGEESFANNTEYELVSNLSSSPEALLELTGTDFRAALLAGSAGIWLPPYCDQILWELGGASTIEPGAFMTFTLAL